MPDGDRPMEFLWIAGFIAGSWLLFIVFMFIAYERYWMSHILRYPLITAFVFAYPTWDFAFNNNGNVISHLILPSIISIGLIFLVRSDERNNSNISERRKKKKTAKRIAGYLQPTIQSAIREDTEKTKDTLSSDLYYGYILGYVTQQLRRDGYEDGEFDFKIVFNVIKNLSNRRVAEAHRSTIEAFFDNRHHLLGRDVKEFEDGFKVGEYDANNISTENLRNILLAKKLRYKL